MKIKRIIIILLIFTLIGTAFYVSSNYISSFKTIEFDAAPLKESNAFIQNPYQGFYNMYGYCLTDEDNTAAITLANTIIEKNNPLILLQINLKNFKDQDLSQAALLQLDTLLSSCKNADIKLILRFLYDWDGKAKDTEPSDISQILSHMNSVSDYVNQHKEAVYILQGIFVGNCGEMNNSVYLSNENMQTLINHLHQCIDKDIYLAVRTPAHYRIINNRLVPLEAKEAFNGTLSSRLSLFNDGMLGSDIDLGTYGTTSREGSTTPETKGTRAEEIQFQNTLCSYVPNGGECVIDNSLNDFDNAISDFRNMHVSYLNCLYDEAVLEKWRNSTYTGNDVFNGMNGYDYISNHLGYRYHISDANISYTRFKNRQAQVSIKIKNTGFSPAYKKFTGKFLIIGADNITLISDFDNRFINSDSEAEISVNINTDNLSKGSYNLYYIMTDSSCNSETVIKFANEDFCNETGVYIGRLTVS